MSTTEQALEALTDSALFERVAMAALRFFDPDFSLVIPYGVNAEGKTVSSRVDGLVRVPNHDPPRYAIVEITTEKLSKLRGKWLAQSDRELHNTDVNAGDLVRAARESQRLTNEYPSATFKVGLVTNRQPSPDLMDDVEKYASAHKLVIVPITRGPLAHFLDDKEDGNYLRERLLGVRQTRLSRELLHDIGTEMLALYAATLRIENRGVWIKEPYMDALNARAYSRNRLSLLVGDSGRGKSSASYELMKNTLLSGGLAIWCPAEDFVSPQRWDSSILNAIRRVRPDIDGRAGLRALAMSSDEPLIVVIDDVNRLAEPVAVIDRLIGQSIEDDQEQVVGSGTASPRVHIVLPVLPKFTKAVGKMRSQILGSRTVVIPHMDAETASALVEATRQGISVHYRLPADSLDIARALANDPYLIAIWGRLRFERRNEPSTSAVVDQYLDDRYEAAATKNQLVGADVNSAFRRLANAMLLERQFEPTWDQVTQWLGDDVHLAAIRAMLREADVCELRRVDGIDRVVFQHDRLRDHILAKAFLPPIDAHRDIASDPFYAEVMATAATISELSAEWACRLCELNPLAAAILISDNHAIDTERKSALADALRKWWAGTPSNDDTVNRLGAVRAAIIQYWSTHSSILAPELLRDEISFDAFTACARAGDLMSTIELCISSNIGMADAWRDEAVLAGDRISGGLLATEIEALLLSEEIGDTVRSAALSAAGILGKETLAEACATSWSRSIDRNLTLEEGLYAIVRTSDEPNSQSAPLVDHWASLDRSREDDGTSERARHTLSLPFSLARISSEKLVPWLRHVHVTHPELLGALFEVAEKLRDPEGVRFLVELLTTLAANKGAQAAGFYRMMLRSRFDNPKLDAPAMDALQCLWTDENLSATFRNQAFFVWADNATTADFGLLARHDNPAVFGENVLAERVRFGDPSTRRELAARIITAVGPSQLSWIQFATSNWTELGVRAALYGSIMARALHYRDEMVSEHVIMRGTGDEDLFISRVLRDLPAPDVERVLLANWQSLGHVDKYLAAGLFVGTEALQRAVHNTLLQVEDANALFNRLHGYFGFNEYGRSDLLTIQHAERLRPYFHRLPKNELGYIARWCNEHDHRLWRRAHLDSYLDEIQRRDIAPTESDLLEMLERDIARHVDSYGAERWFRWTLMKSDFAGRSGMDLLARWFAAHIDDDAAFEACADVLITHGERRDLEWLSQELSPGRKALFNYTLYAVQRRSLS